MTEEYKYDKMGNLIAAMDGYDDFNRPIQYNGDATEARCIA